ncbi:putative DsbA family dithiol-disulfide isomerase [Actinocorallia herbida]|uniref:Putative DsbA family dithiol-disulfide isomerase n=1 Tax=Actinocorallia herbida TaxID=58109 RepID=A0A3N1CWU7_9ACTN|nr:DsbA family protein [Actinocorallia herbida]ROO85769.1 putative DsbA family dithiol-disulfide isomerase [Actinocorallia herbida]
MTAAVDCHIDPMCPFAYATSLWLREVRDALGVELNWRFFSLEEVNRAEGKKHPWERPWSYGWSLMRIGALLRRRDMAALDAWYGLIGAELHERGGKPHDPDVARRLLDRLGFGAATLDEALADETTHADVLADHRRVLDAGGYGVPTLFFPDGQCLFGPVLIDPPAGVRAVRLWDVVTGTLEFPDLYEIQRPKGTAEKLRIHHALQPYLTGRDWISVDRGEVIEFPESPGGAQ